MRYRIVGLIGKWRWIICCMVWAGFMVGCGEEPPIKIGFLGGVSGRVADLGIAGRDATMFAVEEVNQAGGINGRKVELLVRDDQQNTDAAKAAVSALIKEDVIAIIGPMTSSIAVEVKPLVDAGKIVMISPTVKTDQLSGMDDYFLRVTTPLSKNARKMASYAVDTLHLKNFVVVYDTSNQAFTETWLNFFKAALTDEGGTILYAEAFNSSPDTHFLPIAERIKAQAPDGVLLLSNAIDTAMLSQQIRKLEMTTQLFATEWAFTTDLLSFGGHAVDGIISFHSFNADSQEPRYLEFKTQFTKRFGYAPAFSSMLAYDAATFLFRGIRQDTVSSTLKETLIEMATFPGLQSQVAIDRFGDVDRRLFMTTVADRSFKVVE